MCSGFLCIRLIPPVICLLFFCLILVMGICSSLASVCAEEQEVLAAERRGETPEQEDCFLWVNT